MAPEFSIREIPFSRSGAWFDLSPVVGLATYADDVHLVSHRNGMHPVLSLVPVAGGGRPATVITTDPATITWQAVAGAVGYNVRWGIAPSKLYQTYQRFGDQGTSLELRALSVGQAYWVAIESFDENGVSPLSQTVQIR